MNGRASWPDVAFLAEESLLYTLDSPAFLGDPAIWARVTQGEPTLALLSSTKAPAGDDGEEWLRGSIQGALAVWYTIKAQI